MSETPKETQVIKTIKKVEAAEVREQPTKIETSDSIDKPEPDEITQPLKVTNKHRFLLMLVLAIEH